MYNKGLDKWTKKISSVLLELEVREKEKEKNQLISFASKRESIRQNLQLAPNTIGVWHSFRSIPSTESREPNVIVVVVVVVDDVIVVLVLVTRSLFSSLLFTSFLFPLSEVPF